MTKGNIRAFSITEVLVSLVVSAIVVGIIFVLFEILSERMYDFRDQNQYISDLNRFTYSVNKDIFESDKLHVREGNMEFSLYSGEKIKYSTGAEYIVRKKQDFIDTFRLSDSRLKIDTLSSETKKIIYQRLKVEVTGGESNYNLSFFKKVYSESLIVKNAIQ